MIELLKRLHPVVGKINERKPVYRSKIDIDDITAAMTVVSRSKRWQDFAAGQRCTCCESITRSARA